jgi:hypothetical protein
MALVAPNNLCTKGGMIARAAGTCSLAIHTSIGSCDVLMFSGWAGGAILVPASVTNLTWHGSADGSNFYAIYDTAATAAAVTQGVTASTWVPIPDACFAFPSLKVVSTGATGTATVVCKS